MKFLLVAAIASFFLVAPLAADTFSFTPSAGQLVKLDHAILVNNQQVCESVFLPKTCTQAEARAAGLGNEDVFRFDEADRERYLRKYVFAPWLAEQTNTRLRHDRARATPWDDLDQVDADAICVLRDRIAGCVLP